MSDLLWRYECGSPGDYARITGGSSVDGVKGENGRCEWRRT